MKVDKNTGLVEMIMDKLEEKDEGTYTFQLQDGKATNQSSLVLIGDGRLICIMQWAGFSHFSTPTDLPGFLCHNLPASCRTGHVCELKFFKWWEKQELSQKCKILQHVVVCFPVGEMKSPFSWKQVAAPVRAQAAADSAASHLPSYEELHDWGLHIIRQAT